MNETQQGSSTIFSLHGVRYQVTDVARAVAFYTNHLGFKLEHQQLPRVCQRVARTFQAAAQRAWRIGIPADGQRRIPAVGRMESSGPARGRSAGADRRAEERGGEVFAIRWRLAPPAGRSRPKTPTAIQSSCSSRLDSRRKSPGLLGHRNRKYESALLSCLAAGRRLCGARGNFHPASREIKQERRPT